MPAIVENNIDFGDGLLDWGFGYYPNTSKLQQINLQYPKLVSN